MRLAPVAWGAINLRGHTMYATSEEALEDRSTLSLDRARAELARHGCRIIADEVTMKGVRIHVTNDMDEPEWIESTPQAILIWLGY